MAFYEKNNNKHKKFMKSLYKKIIFIISAIALFSVIAGVVKYSLTYIENNPEKYLPTQKQDKKLSINSLQKNYKVS